MFDCRDLGIHRWILLFPYCFLLEYVSCPCTKEFQCEDFDSAQADQSDCLKPGNKKGKKLKLNQI